MTRLREEQALRAIRPPMAPPALRQRALAAARQALIQEAGAQQAGGEPRPLLTNRLWQSRNLRLGWLAAATLLLGLNLRVALSPPPPVVAQADSMTAWQYINDPDELSPLQQKTPAPGRSRELLEYLLTDGPADSRVQSHSRDSHSRDPHNKERHNKERHKGDLV